MRRLRFIATRLSVVVTAGVAAVSLVLGAYAWNSDALIGHAQAQSLPAVTVTGIMPNHSSARIFYNPVPGAKDYRVYDVANPNGVKYAGLAHYTDASGSNAQDVPAVDIEWNELNDANPHTLVVEAVDAVGPVPQTSLYQGPPNGAKTPLAPGGMLGSNKGNTLDGKISTNGQGPYTNKPHAIAQSQPLVVQAHPEITPLGKVAGASQQFLDTFDQSEAASLQHTVHNPCGTDAVGDVGVDTYSLNAGTSKESTIELRLHDSDNSMPFISNSHFMDMLFSGQTASCGGGTDITYGSLALTPKQVANMGSGMILHQSMEVDMHGTSARWMAFDVSPASDPIQSWEPDLHPANNHSQALYVDLLTQRIDVRVFNGSTTPAFSVTPAVLGQLYIPNDGMLAGRGFDDRSRLDLFVSQTHLAIFQDNTLLTQVDIPASAMPWFNGAVKTYFTHYMYHSDNDLAFLRSGELSGQTFCYPMNAYWFNDAVHGLSASQDACGIAYPPGYGFPHSDERHWDNMGFEVLPSTSAAANDFSPLGAVVQLPPAPPLSVGGGVILPTNTPVGSSSGPPTSTATSVPTTTPTSTATSVPTTTPTSTATSLPTTGSSGQGQSAGGAGGTSAGQWVNITPSNVNLTSSLSCGNYGTQSVVADPGRPSNLYAQFHCQGIWKSVDFGQTWTGPINTGANGATARDCAGGITLAPTAGQPTLFESCVRGAGLGFWRSTDGGVNWQRFQVAPGGARQDFFQPQVDPYDANHLIMAGHEQNLLVQSTDGGQTWTSVPMASGMNQSGGTAFISFINSGNASTTRTTWLYIAQGSGGTIGTWRTTNGGSSWTHVDSNEHAHGSAQIYQPDTSGVVYMAGLYSASGGGVLRSADYGQTWTHEGCNCNEAIVYGTANDVYAGWGWACFLCNVPPTLQVAPQPGMTGWTSVGTPPAMSEGPAMAAAVFDGTRYAIVTANWTSGLWRFTESGSGAVQASGQAAARTSASTFAPTRTPTPQPTARRSRTPRPQTLSR